MSKVEKDHDQTMSVASDDDGQLQYNPSFETVLRDDDDDSSVPPPPPPTHGISLAKISSSIFRSRTRESKHVTSVEDEEIGGHRPVQILPAQDESKTNIEVDAAEQWIQKFGMNQERNGQKRRSKLCTAVLLTLVILMVIAIIVSRNVNQATSNQSEKMLVNPTASPSAAPQSEGTEPPTALATVLATNGTDSPAQPCTSAVVVQQACYEPQSEITISFTNCAPLPDDWIGIWREEDVTDVTNLPEPRLWQWVCGAQICETPVEQDSLVFAPRLRPGTYVAQFVHMEQDQAPYTGAFASSSTFEVSENCS